MKSVWTDKIDKTCPLPEYPRPQLVRENWMNLNGIFSYAILPQSQPWPERYDGEILVPFAVESLLSGVEKPLLPNERLWYQKCFTLPERMAGKTILLHFGAVDWKCRVYINKTLVGEHTGGECAVSFYITPFFPPRGKIPGLRVHRPPHNRREQRRQPGNQHQDFLL